MTTMISEVYEAMAAIVARLPELLAAFGWAH
jgi:hypothetical protein